MLRRYVRSVHVRTRVFSHVAVVTCNNKGRGLSAGGNEVNEGVIRCVFCTGALLRIANPAATIRIWYMIRLGYLLSVWIWSFSNLRPYGPDAGRAGPLGT